jgi:transcriptional regulator with XRE-family HTH domain
MKTRIYQARKLRGWTSAQLNQELREAATRLGLTVSTPASLRVQISGWENGHHDPDSTHRTLLQEAFDLPAEALGFDNITHDELTGSPLPGFVERDAFKNEISDELLAYFGDQLAVHVRADNAVGPAFVLTTTNIQLQQLNALAASSSSRELNLLTARYSEFAGWLLQDCGDNVNALCRTDRAVELAEANGDLELTTYNLMRKSNILTSLRESQRATVVAHKAVVLAEREAPSLLPVCLRQYALTQSYLRREHTARSALQRALELSEPAMDTGNELSPYCTTSYVQMEAALCLLALSNPAAAATACETAVERWPAAAGLIRDESLCLARLAVTRSQLRQVDEACHAIQRAVELVKRAPSVRVIHMLRLAARKLEPFRGLRTVQEASQALTEVT